MYLYYGLIFSLVIICEGGINLSAKQKDTNPVLNFNVTKTLELPQADVGRVMPKSKTNKLSMAKFSRKKPASSENAPKPQTSKHGPKTISPKLVKEWASEISEALFETEAKVVRRDMLLKSFSDIKIEVRDGAATVERASAALEELLLRRAEAARKIVTKAEELAKTYHKVRPPRDYTFFDSMDLDVIKEEEELPVKPQERMWKFPTSCRSNDKLKLENSAHFDSKVSLEHTSVKTAQEVFICDKKVKSSVYWSEKLLPVFQENYAEDATTSFQYFCSAKGFMRHFPGWLVSSEGLARIYSPKLQRKLVFKALNGYDPKPFGPGRCSRACSMDMLMRPAALWDDMYKLKIDTEDTDVYDCRLRPWYVAAGGAPRDILIMLDATGSMTSKNENLNLIAEVFTLTLLTALTDDDQVNVLRFNNLINVTSPIACFNNKLVSANHVNSAAMMAAMKGFPAKNKTQMDEVLKAAVTMLQKQNNVPGRSQSCQQAIVLLTDSLERNYTEKLREWDPEGHIRLFVMWLHEREGMRDHTRTYGEWATCTKDGSFAELVTPNDATQQVMNILQVLDRPLVHQRKDHPSVFSDVYAHAEDPRRGEFHWRQKESEEQNYRYRELRKDKASLMSDTRRQRHYMHQLNLDQSGDYYELENIHYRLQISVAVPVFDHVTVENITTELFEEKRRKSTRTYPVNRLLGVAGVDIPLDDLKLILPYHELGAGSTIFIIDHRGSIVLHDDMKPTFDGDILKPGYRTVDMIDLEQSAVDHLPRHYPHEWLEFRNTVVRDQPKGDKIMYAKNILDGGMRALLEHREYHWRRVLNHYTVVVVQPRYSRLHAVPEAAFTQKLAQDATSAFHGTDFALNPEWLYCRHVEPYFTKREREVSHFLRRRSEEPNFPMKNLKHFFSPLPPTIFEKTYQCNENLMARLCKEATATEQWAREHEEPGTDRDCTTGCYLGSNTAFFASESGLTRWQLYHTVGSFHPPEGDEWPGGPTESWYNRAAAAPDTLVVHAPVSPIRRFRKTEDAPLPLNNRSLWMTAARTLGKPGVGIVGVAGFHFHPKHFHDVVDTATNFACSEDNPDDCEPVCDGKNWTCVVVDDGGWIIGGGQPQDYDEELRDPVRQHLANTHPTTLALLLNASIFKLHWVHDYQAVCFPPQNETAYCAASKLMTILQFFPSLLYSAWNTLYLLATVTRDLMFAFISMSGQVQGDTLVELQKRRNATIRSYEREKFDQLYDRRVLINKTRFAACDRTRPVYELQRTQAALEALSRAANICEWPLVGALIPRTNLVLLAVYNPCPARGRPPPNPLINAQVEMTEEIRALNHSANRLACWRDRVPLPTRPPNTKCYPHQYADEEGYRQCGPWLSDPEEQEEEEDDYVIDKSLKDYYADWREVDEIYS